VEALSAWAWTYKHGWVATTDRQVAGLHAVKAGLISSGYGHGVDLSVKAFGDAATRQTREFQKANGLYVDGDLGPTTARHLWRHYVNAAEMSFQIPDHWLGKMCTLESNNDPVAEGTVDPEDEGLLQIHRPFHPELTLAEVWSPAFIVPWAANVLQRSKVSLRYWTAAVASWNIGLTFARQWSAAGFAVKGGPQLGGEDSFARAARYVTLVSEQKW
jgi:hypothetical protein